VGHCIVGSLCYIENGYPRKVIDNGFNKRF
jgi:hypothetical protein